MYEEFYGLASRPFDLTPDPRFLYLTPKHAEALAHLEYGLSGRKGITVLTGEVGTGKTTLLRTALERTRGATLCCAHLSNPMLTRSEFFESLATEFGFSKEAASSKARFLVELNAHVHNQSEIGGVTALVIDEAQALSMELLEEIRLLANIESETEKLLQVILVGQPELATRLNEPGLRQLKQRVALRCALQPLDLGETAAYIAGRMRIAGGEAPRVFTRDAVSSIYAHSRGIPRAISVLCDNALITGFARGTRPIDRRIVLEVCRDFDMSGGGAARAVTVAADVEPPSNRGPEPPAIVSEREHETERETAEGGADGRWNTNGRFTLFGNIRSGARR